MDLKSDFLHRYQNNLLQVSWYKGNFAKYKNCVGSASE